MLLLAKVSMASQAQPNDGGFLLLEIQKISEVFKNKPNLSCSLTYTYADSLTPGSPIETINGQMKISNNKSWTLLGTTEIIDGSQYNLALYHDDSTMVINNKKSYETIMRMPFMDTSFQNNSIASFATTPIASPLKQISILFKPGLGYSKYTITFDMQTWETQSIQYFVKDPLLTSGTAVITLTITNYDAVTPISQDLFNEWKYFHFSNGGFLTNPPYSYFTLYNFSL